jgi:hypothetical protein
MSVLFFSPHDPIEECKNPQYNNTNPKYVSPIIQVPSCLIKAINPFDTLGSKGIIRKCFYQDWLFKLALSENDRLCTNPLAEKTQPYWDMLRYLVYQQCILYQNTKAFSIWYKSHLILTTWDAGLKWRQTK